MFKNKINFIVSVLLCSYFISKGCQFLLDTSKLVLLYIDAKFLLTPQRLKNVYSYTVCPKSLRIKNLIQHDNKMNNKKPLKTIPTGTLSAMIFYGLPKYRNEKKAVYT
jgi:hypothetical protein